MLLIILILVLLFGGIGGGWYGRGAGWGGWSYSPFALILAVILICWIFKMF